MDNKLSKLIQKYDEEIKMKNEYNEKFFNNESYAQTYTDNCNQINLLKRFKEDLLDLVEDDHG